MLIALTMPQFGESITEGHLVRWLKNEGDTVAEAEPVVEMETEKSVFSHESPFKGKIVKLIGNEGDNIPVGQIIAHFDVSDDDGKRYIELGVGQAVNAQPASVSTPSAPTAAAPTPPKPAAPAAAPASAPAVAKEETKSKAPVAGTTIVNVTPSVRVLLKKWFFLKPQFLMQARV